MRLLRMMKLSKSWKALSKILITTAKSLKDISQFTILLVLFMYIFALLGMELFANVALVDEDENLIYGEEAVQALYASGDYYEFPRDNWNNVGFALTTVFILIIGEDWNWTMYQWVRAFGAGSTANEVLAILFFIILMIVGNIVLFSVFTAILLQNFDDMNADEEEGEEEEEDAAHLNASALQISHEQSSEFVEKESFAKRLCGKEAREKYVHNFKMAFGGKERKSKAADKKVATEEDQAAQDQMA